MELSRKTAQIQLTFQVNFEHDDSKGQRFDAGLAIAHDLQQAIRDACRSSEDRLRYKELGSPRLMWVTNDDGDSFL